MFRFFATFVVFFGIALSGIVSPAVAVEPVLWRDDTQAAFLRGEADGVAITRDGAVTLSPELKILGDTEESFVWAVARGPKGRVYVGTGNEGRVYAIDASGKTQRLFDSPEVSIYSIAVAGNGTVYAGSSPAGLIYKLAPGKEPVTFARTQEQHIWAIIPDGKGGIIAATGGAQGKVIGINSAGETTVLCETSDHNVMSLLKAPDGTLYAGTDESGLIYRIRGSQSEVLYDAKEPEVRSLALGADGSLYAAAMTGSLASPGQRPRNGGAPPQQKSSGSVVYSIRPSGSGFRIWESDDPVILALALEPAGTLLAVTGDAGRVYRLYPDGAHDVVAQTAPMRPGAAAADGDGILIGAAGSGKVLRMMDRRVEKGSLTSKPRDFSLVSTWGQVSWKAEVSGGAKVSLQARSGNSEEPNDAWSDWSGDHASGTNCTASPARFLQYRLNLVRGTSNNAPLVHEVRLSGQQENVEPMILSLRVTPPGSKEHAENGGSRNGGAPGGRRNGPPPSAEEGWLISWEGGDVNKDALEYTLHFKGRTEREWKLLEEGLTTSRYVWATDSAPEGTVQVRVTVSDGPSNPPSAAFERARVSEPFDIDHTDPIVVLGEIAPAGAGAVHVTATVRDATTPLRAAAYSLNSGAWDVVFPADGIFDSPDEALAFTLDGLAAGEYTLVVRSEDERGNVGVAKRVFTVKR